MPVISFEYQDLLDLLGRDINMEGLLEKIPMMGADLHSHDMDTGEMAIEFFPDRPDLFSVEGIARALRTFLDIDSGLRRYQVGDSGITLHREDSVEGVRPFVVGGVMKEMVMTDELIRSLMELQEKIHLTMGRKRAKVSIGIHDMDKVEPPFTYRAVPPEEVSFVPLGKEEEMDLGEILERHEKGREYAFILDGKDRYPLIQDRHGQVLSFPPIINGRLTTVTEETTDLFIDVTGTDYKAIDGALNIVATSIAERGPRIESILIKGREERRTPDLEPRQWELDPEFCRSFLGLDIGDEEVGECLGRMGYDHSVRNGVFHVLAPATRMDLLHQVDLAEDVAIGHGYENLGSRLPKAQTYGCILPLERASDLLKQLMVGYGYLEVQTLMLSNPWDQFGRMGLPERDCVEVGNPIGEDYTCIRVNLLPSLMNVLAKNKHRDLPQRIFEVGDVIEGRNRRRHFAGVVVHSKANFTEMKSLVKSVMRDLSLQHSLEPLESGIYIHGRGASVFCGDQEVGHFGEMRPSLIVDYELSHPIACFELDMESMLSKRMQSII
ncbi:MAG: phenylalanine--tRNA ligase subunit beta [Methanomassiliicoccales archaeon]